MAQAHITLRVDSQTDRLHEPQVHDARNVSLEAHGLEIKAAASKLVIPWHRVHEVKFGP